MITGSTRVEQPGWRDIPLTVRAQVCASLDTDVVRALRQSGEVVGGVCARAELGDGDWVFVRAVPADHPLVGNYRAEATVTAQLPSTVPTAHVRCVVDAEWFVLITDDVDGVRPNLRPGSPDASAVLASMSRCARALTPCPIADAPDALVDLGGLLSGWHELSVMGGVVDSADAAGDGDGWARRNLESLIAIESAWHPWAAGDTLLHNDIRPEHLVRVGPGRVVLTGWRYPARGAAWLDIATLVPQLILAGHSPASAERLVLRRPEFTGVPAWAVTGFAAARSGYLEFARRLPEPDGSGGLRAQQGGEATAALSWIRHRTRWP